MSSMLDFFISLFEFGSCPFLNCVISLGVGYLAFKISFFIVGIIAPLLLFDSELMSVVHWVIRFILVIITIYYCTQLTLWITIPVALIGLGCLGYKIFC